MAVFDGSIKIDTKIDTSGFSQGLSTIKKAAGTLGLAKLGKEIIDVGSTFESSMSQVAAISMATGEDLEALTATAKELGATTKYTAAEAADGLQYLSLAGYTAAESIEALPKVLRLAQAGGIDLAYASDLLTDSMAVMGLGIQDMDNFSDQLAMAASKSNTSVAQLGEAVLVAGGQAKLAAMSTEEMNTALGILADNGIKGSEGGTALRNVLKNLYTPTSASAKVMKELGIETADSSGKLKKAQDVLSELKGKLDKMDESTRIKTMGDIFDTRTIAAANALLANSGERWSELEGYLSDCDGAAKTMAETMNDNLGGSLDEMSSAAEALGITIYEKAVPAIREIVDMLTNQIGAVDSFLGANDGQNLVMVATAIGSITAALVGYKVSLTAVTAAQTLFNSTLALNPIGLTVAAIAGCVVALGALDNAVNGEVRALEKEKTAYLELKEATTQDAETKALEINRAQALAEELDKLVDTNGRIKSGYEDRVSYITGELSEATGIEIQVVDGVIKKYDDLKTKLNEVLRTKEMATLSEGVEENYRNAVNTAEEYRVKIAELKTELDNVTAASREEIKQTKMIPQAMTNAQKAYQTALETYENATRDKVYYGEMLAAAEEDNYKLFMQLYRDYDGVVSGSTTTALEGATERKAAYEAERESLQKLKEKAESEGDVKLAEQYKNEIITLESEIAKLDGIIETEAAAIEKQAYESGTSIGQNLADGVAEGISDKSSEVITAAKRLVIATVISIKNEAEIHSPSRVTRYIGQMLSLGAAYGIEDNADMAVSAMEAMSAGIIDKSLKGAERQEAIRERTLKSLKNSLDIGLITEEKYYKELEKVRDEYFDAGSEEWEKYTLEILKYNIESAEKQRNAVADIYDGMVDDINSRLDEIKQSREALADSFRNIEDGFRTVTYVGLTEDGVDIVDTMLNVAGLRQANDLKEAFEKSALAAKTRISEALGAENSALSNRIYESILAKGAEEGIKLSDAVINADSNTFSEWIAQQLRSEELNESVSQALYKDMASQVGEDMSKELYAVWDAELTEQFGQLPEDFWGFGEDAAKGFYDGFMEDINTYMNAIERQIAIRISEITSSTITAGSGIGGGTTYSPSYYIQSSPGESTQAQLSAIRSAEAINKARGGY